MNAALFAIITFAGILLFIWLGHCAGKAALARNPAGETRGIGAIEGALFGLLGLMIAFTFSGAAARFEDRRHLITEEANAIGTAWLRIDLLPADTQPAIRGLFLQYTENRATAYRSDSGAIEQQEKLRLTSRLQQQIWNSAVQASQRSDASNQAGMLLLPALNEMIDITTTRQVATENHPPRIIFYLLMLLTFVAAFTAGLAISGNTSQIRVYKFIFAFVMSLTLFVTVDLELPREGLIRIDDADHPINELLDGFRKQVRDR